MLSKFSVRKPYTVVVAVVLVIILGVVSFMNMTVDLLPSMNLPYAIVMTTYVGASPEEVETAVTKPIEQSMATVSNIKNITSTSQENASTVILEFEQTANMDSTTIDMREKLDQIKGYWPDTVNNPIIMKLNPDMMPVMVAAIGAGEDSVSDSSAIIENDVLPDIESLEGVASVSSFGTVEKTVQITIDKNKIAATNQRVQNALNGKFDDAQQKIDEGKAQLEDGKAQLESGKNQLTDQLAQASEAEAQILEGEAQIDSKMTELEDGEKQLDAAQTQLDEGRSALEVMKAALDSQKQTALEKAYAAAEQGVSEQFASSLETMNQGLEALEAQLEQAADDAQRQQIQAQIDTMKQQIAAVEQSRDEAVDAAKKAAEEQVEAGFEQGYAKITESQEKLDSSQKELDAGKTQLAEGKKQLEAVRLQLTEGKISLAQAQSQIETAKITATIEMATVNAQMATAETKLDEGQTELDNSKSDALEAANVSKTITTDMVEQLLTAENFSMPAGYVKEEGIDYLIRVGDKYDNIDDIKAMPMFDMDIEGLDTIRLSDVADVTYVNNEDEVYAKINGEPGVLLTVQKQTGYSTGDVSGRILDKFDELRKENKDLDIVTLMDQGVYIDLIVNSVLQNMLFGAVLAILILLLFLRSIRPTFIIACSIPISIVTALVLMYFSGVTLNVISLSGLALGVGMLVDNSIVVIENIYRMRNEEGASAKEAAIEGARQVSGAIAASTFTTVCVFAPIVFTQGITRQLFVDMGLTIAYSLLASLVIALTFVPMMSAGLLNKQEKKETKLFEKIKKVYGGLLRRALRWKPLVLLAALAMLVVSGLLAYSNGTAFMPDMESTQISMTVTTEKGSTMQETGEVADQVMEKLLAIDDIKDVGAMASTDTYTGQAAATNEVELYGILKDDKKLSNDKLQKKIEEETKDLPCELDISMSNMDMSALGSSGIVVQIKGKDLDTLQTISKDIAKRVEEVKGTANVSDGLDDTTEELRVNVKEEEAIRHNLTSAQIYQQLAAKLAAQSAATTLSTDVDDYDVIVVDQKNEELTREAVKNLSITATKKDGTKEEVPLTEIAEFETAMGLQSINHDAQNRIISVTAEIAEGDNIGLVSSRVQKALKSYEMPDGYTYEMTGEDETIQESMVELFKMLALAIVFMYLIMVAQFQSLRSPFIVMFTVPLAFTGGLFGLYLTGNPISIIAMVGFVMLSGIIVNNGIVFIDYTNQLMAAGMERQDALVESGRTRLRPIIMTALTTILGLSTMAIGVGMGADMVQPMAVVTIGGLIYGTLLTLFVVPCIFDLFHKREKARLRESIETNEKPNTEDEESDD
ncbi:efflux RND transporter permease subunit [Hespellia stercorisuis]|uniref:Multidrug efflux pump subunit AcrB n=1 Tax=Hespellia stercorisuis DSM 15480 TaxID=1121950 RepID=A0A1M6LBW7_9FIRM|nr:efflux RND transporter permease subunit [Hespellia stercorisuis]SHJ68678.1 Multidrug efflux pump subunit AcrB [Hespellia stercorisuis DSM 15480]